ncbi:MAG: hypothetical protein WCW66_03200 [Patescibacteria group bacterium]
MNKKLKIAFIIMMAMVVIITIVVVIIFYTSDRTDVTNTNAGTNTNTAINSNVNTNQAVNVNSVVTNTNTTVTNTNSTSTAGGTANVEALLQPIARNFAERFGSYSSFSNYENITKLEGYMTASMKNWAERFVAEQRANSSADDKYFGITTKALNVTTDSINEADEKAQFTVTTQRNQTNEGEEAKVIYQDIIIKFIKEGIEWKVIEANWQN